MLIYVDLISYDKLTYSADMIFFFAANEADVSTTILSLHERLWT